MLSKLLVVAVAALLLVAIGDGGTALAAYPGGNGKIAYESAVEGNFEIFVMNADGTGQTNVSNDATAGGNNRDPVWSPDGTKIAFSRAGEGHMNVWVMNADGSAQVNLTPGAATADGTFGAEPTWSPDGTKIAYNSGGSIFVMDASGAGKVRLTPIGEADAQPAWSPDGAKIAFVRQGDIWVMGAVGSGRTALASSARGEFRPEWSPDGARIAYDRDGQIWAMNADGSGQTQLTGDAIGETGSEPAWSPDGTKIVFASNGNGAPNGHDVFVMNADGTGITRLDTPVPASDLDPSWQPVGLPTLAIGDANVGEGDAGTAVASFEVTLSSPSTTSVAVSYATADGTATAPGDYAAASGTLTFAPGETRKTVVVAVAGDAVDESDEVFFVDLSAPANATLADARGAGTIVDDDVVDSTAPSIVVSTPTNGAAYALGANVIADYSCSDEVGGSGVASCDGTVADGAAIDTSSPGAHSLSVVATDRAGNRSSVTVGYTVERSNALPLASFTYAPSAPTAADTVTFDASGSSDPDGDPLKYEWAVDGAPVGTGVTISRTFSAGTHTVQLTVSDGRGGSASTSATVTVSAWTVDGELAMLIAKVETWRLSPAARLAVLASLYTVRSWLADGRPGACLLLGTYRTAVEVARFFGLITRPQAAEITTSVNRIRRALLC